MLHNFTPEQIAVRDKAREIAAIINNDIDAIDRAPGHSDLWWKAVHQLEEAGLTTLFVPKALGGGGADILSLVLAQEEIGKVDGGFSNIVSHEACAYVIFTNLPNPELRERCVQRMLKGDLTCIALTEAGTGTDLAGMQTEAVRDGDDWILTGHKCVASMGAVAGMYLVFAITDRSKGTKGISAFLVDKGAEGMTLGEISDVMGYRQLPPAEVFFDKVRVPAAQLLGQENEGLKIFAQALNLGRLGGASQALGIAQGAFELALTHARTRRTFGKPLIEHQALQFSLAEMQIQIEASRALIYQVARWMQDVADLSERDVGTLCAIIKSQASDMAMKVTVDAVQMFGAWGNYRNRSVERLMRDAKVTQLVDGPNEVMKMRIGHALKRG